MAATAREAAEALWEVMNRTQRGVTRMGTARIVLEFAARMISFGEDRVIQLRREGRWAV